MISLFTTRWHKLLIGSLLIVVWGLSVGCARPQQTRQQSSFLWISDRASEQLMVYDLQTDEVVERVEVDQQTYLEKSQSNQFLLLSQRPSGRIQIINTETRETVGDKEMDAPGHTGSPPGHLGVFADGEGTAYMFSESDLEQGRLKARTIDGGLPHHGNAELVGPHVITSVKKQETEGLAKTLRVYSPGKADREVSCARAHGHASGEGWALFPCNGYLQWFHDDEKDHLSIEPVSYPERMGDRRLWSVSKIPESQAVVGVSGQDVVTIHGQTGEINGFVLPKSSWGGAIGENGRGVTVTSDGAVHLVNALQGEILDSLPPGTLETEQADPSGPPPFHPTAVSAKTAIVASPITNKLYQFNLRSDQIKQGNTLEFVDKPVDLAITSGR